MKDAKQLAGKIRELNRAFLQGDKEAREQIKALAWAADVPVEFINELLDEEAGQEEMEQEIKNLKEQAGKLRQMVDDLTDKREQIGKAEEDAKEFKALAESYAQELEEKKKELDSSKSKISTLETRLLRKDNNRKILISYGREKNFYPGEQEEVVMEILKDAYRLTPEGTRRSDILKSLIDENPVYGTPKMIAERIKQIFKDGEISDDQMRKDLALLGIEAKRNNKHCFLTLGGDDRYTATVPTTQSDKRSGMNVATDIIRKMF